ncbi:MAG: nucleotide sugar dehydrogenase [Nanoarchaeota archaeon]|nr:nucleotide sugar dehydrogenase [Nanoarchaeota archaeon]
MITGIVGLGYVGLPLAVELAKHYQIIGFDINLDKINELNQGIDKTNEVDVIKLKHPNLTFTSDETKLKEADYIIVAVPTPIDKAKKPDFSYIKSSSEIIGRNLKDNAIVIYESTVSPGTTEEICQPIIEKISNKKCGSKWKIAYSPERIVPGDKLHTLTNTIKIVSGMDPETLDKVADLYSKICPIYKATSIKVAEAAKITENVQRDLNIAIINELSLIFHELNIDTFEVLEAAGTKFNFHHYHPGLVGGHCISVDPYYLTEIAQQKGYYPKVILSGREVNERIATHIAHQVLKNLNNNNKVLKESNVLVMGLTFKENVSDMRNSKVKEMIDELKSFQVNVIGLDPLLTKEEIEKNLGISKVNFEDINENLDAVIVAQGHNEFKSIKLQYLAKKLNNLYLFDIKRFYDKKEAIEKGFTYESL